MIDVSQQIKIDKHRLAIQVLIVWTVALLAVALFSSFTGGPPQHTASEENYPSSHTPGWGRAAPREILLPAASLATLSQ